MLLKNKFIIVLLFIIIIIIILLIKQHNRHEKFDKPKELQDLPPLNYYTLDEPDYFFYDAYVDNYYGNDDVKFTDKPSKKYINKPHMNNIFGPDNYLRYYL